MTRHMRAAYVKATLGVAGMASDEHSSHKDIRKAEIVKSEVAVDKVYFVYISST